MEDIDCNVDNLTESVGAFVDSDEFGDHSRRLGADFPRRDVGGQRRAGNFVAEEGPEEMYEEELKEHTKSGVSGYHRVIQCRQDEYIIVP